MISAGFPSYIRVGRLLGCLKEPLPIEHQMLLMLNDLVVAIVVLVEKHSEGENRVITPQLLLSAFALEIELKCLLKICEIDFPKRAGHNLKTLFFLLPDPNRERIIEIHRKQSETYGRSAAEADAYFHDTLEIAQEDFVTIRYVYEKRGGHETRNLGPLVLAIYSYIFEVRPEWKDHQVDLGLTN